MTTRELALSSAADLARLTPDERAAAIAHRRHPAVRAVRGGVCDLLGWRYPDRYAPVQWHRDLGAVCDSLVAGALSRSAPWVCIGAPPRHGKSEHVGRAMGPRLMAMRPGASVLYATSTADRAEEVSAAARGMVEALFRTGRYPHLEPGRKWTVTEWATIGGNAWTGIGSGASTGGIGAHLIIADDVTGSDERQASAPWKRTARRWLAGDVLTRDAGGAAVCLMETRRGLDDMQGWALDEWPGRWSVHTWRCLGPDGEYLWPERYGAAWHAGRPDLAPGTRVWETQYQQRPTREGGSVILEAWTAHRYPGPARAARSSCVQVWVVVDPAGKTAERNDPSGVGVIGLRADGVVMVLHMEAIRRDYPGLRQRVTDLAAEWRATGILVEDSSTGLALVPDLRAARLPVLPVSVSGRGDKVLRMQPHLTRWASGLILLPESEPWTASLVGELTSVPDCEHDDQWDVMSIVLHHIAANSGNVRERLAGQSW